MAREMNGQPFFIRQDGLRLMSASGTVLVVDDDPRVCRLLARYLGQEGYAVTTTTNGEELDRLVATEQPDLVILDLVMPGKNGFTLARELRSQSDVAIIMLTGKTETVDKVVGLELGADDYVTKPFDERELLARVRSVLRRRAAQTSAGASSHQGSVARFNGWQLDLTAHQLTSPAGNDVHLTSHEFKLLSAFVTRRNRALSRDEILRLVGGRHWSPYDRSIDVLLGKLRKKIEEDAKNPKIIQTIRGVGYMFTANVEWA